jgi:hypothetical protein
MELQGAEHILLTDIINRIKLKQILYFELSKMFYIWKYGNI